MQYNDIIKHIITNSLFTERQIYILYNKFSGRSPPDRISKGAYYRQLKQSEQKIVRVLYSLIILRYLNMIDTGTFHTIEVILDNTSHLMESIKRDTISQNDSRNVISLLDEIIQKLIHAK
ncbi:MAG: hypothetical protein ACRD5E_03100 [Nitrososphaeraceae archaeon]